MLMHGDVAIFYASEMGDRNLEGFTRPKNARIGYRTIERIQPNELFWFSQAAVSLQRRSIEPDLCTRGSRPVSAEG